MMKIIFLVITTLFNYLVISNKSPNELLQKYELQELSNYTQKFKYLCLDSSSCSKNGICLNKTHCNCSKGYKTIIIQEVFPSLFQCNYFQKSKLTAFLISFFLGPLSFDQFYLGNNILGLIKLFIPSSLILVGVSMFIIGKKNDSRTIQICGKILEFNATILLIIWWFIDWILILSNYYKDLNNVEMF